MNKYCSKKGWIDGRICGATCIQYGILTDPNCNHGKKYLKIILAR